MMQTSKRLRIPALFVLAACAEVAWAGLQETDSERPVQVDYLRDVKPILAARCFACHGGLQRKSGLRLDASSLIRKGGKRGAAVVPGKGRESLLIKAVTGEAGFRMPAEGEPLSDEQIGVLRAWIDQGAEAPDEEIPRDPREHWAYQPPVRPKVPQLENQGWVRNAIDAFLAAEHAKRGLNPLPEADRRTLLRRVYLDLIGLPPTRDEMRAFLADTSSDAYEQVVERLLASPQYGERWGRHWMDVWRYSDWAGFGAEIRVSQRHIWRWRDWIVESLGADKGYDRMIVEMLAGDEVAPSDPDVVRATGLLARNWYVFNRNVWLDDTIEHTAKAFLGTTINCARCHEHKYDPIAQEDYYRFRAFFEPYDVRTDRVPGEPNVMQNGMARVYDKHLDRPTYLFDRGDEQSPLTETSLAPALPEVFGGAVKIEPVSVPLTAYYPGMKSFVQQEALASAAAELESALEKAGVAGADDAPAQKRLATARARLAAVQARIAADTAKYADPPAPEAAALAVEADRRERQLAVCQAELALEEAEQKLAEAKTPQAVEAAEKQIAEARKSHESALAALNEHPDGYTPLSEVYPSTSTGRRLALARWIADEKNPLTARVAINHMWMRHFGAALVPTVFDFGLGGRPPSHPELLDGLAVELMDSGWSMKHLHRLMVTSTAYRMQSGGATAEDSNAAIDPDNVYLWRMNPRRMEAEVVRDSVLYVAGGLDPTLGGPDLDHNSGQTVPRRSIYFRTAREKQMTFLRLFDQADVNDCYRRRESVVPQQALALANSNLAQSQSRLLARTLSEETEQGGDEAFVAVAFEHVLGRPPSAKEQDTCVEFLDQQATLLSDPTRLTAVSAGAAAAVRPSSDPRQRARENLVHVLFNHNEFVTIR